MSSHLQVHAAAKAEAGKSDSSLLPGRGSLGCTTVRATSEWTKIYNYLIDSRKDDKNVGTLTVT